MARIVLYIAISMDGYIADEQGEMDWLEQFPNPAQEDYGYAHFLSGVEVVVMGRKTYEQILSFGVDWPYPKQKTYVVSRNVLLDINSPHTYVVSSKVGQFLRDLKEQSVKDIWLVGGSKLNTYCLEEGVIDRLILTQIPILLGKGKRLFSPIPQSSSWHLDQASSYQNGVVQLIYHALY
ncbi:MAG TPA: dihydrofolate reductase family protein [Rhodothermales bacterium]|nr:dihydrofolate reductase family protein [Rhodothermales bacterium]HRR07059.1 dihydrofolate reductase family protein [Rhodothermales bacterium]